MARNYSPKVCGDCGKTYVPTGPRQVRCDECGEKKTYPHRPPEPLQERECPNCHRTFMPTHKNRRLCDECRRVVRQPVVRQCIQCGQDFNPGGRAKTCPTCKAKPKPVRATRNRVAPKPKPKPVIRKAEKPKPSPRSIPGLDSVHATPEAISDRMKDTRRKRAQNSTVSLMLGLRLRDIEQEAMDRFREERDADGEV